MKNLYEFGGSLHATDRQEAAPAAGVSLEERLNLRTPPPIPWGDEGGDLLLMRLTKDTTWWVNPCTGAHDFFDMRAHLLTLYQFVMHSLGPGPVRILEVGTREGISTMALLHAAHRRGNCKLLSIECDERNFHATKMLAGSAGYDRPDLWELMYMLSDAAFASLRQRAAEPPIRLAFVDGDHSFAQALRDIDNAVDALAPGGWLIAHDPFADVDCTQPSEVMQAALASSSLQAHCRTTRFILPWSYGLLIARKD